MKNETYLYIPQPCHEDWDKMTPETQGRFCASCEKTVVDFSLMTDNELIKFLSKSKGHLCGRFDSEQLQRPLIETQFQPKKNWKYWLASISALLLLNNKSSAKALEPISYKNNNIEKSNTDTTPHTEPIIIGKLVCARLLEGIVTGTDNKPLLGASIIIKGSEIGAVTDSLGRFSLHINSLPDTFRLVISYVGFERKEVFINKANIQKLNIILKEAKVNLDEVVAIGYGTVLRRDTMGAVSIISSIDDVPKITLYDKVVVFIDNTLGLNPFETYPNPVRKSSSFHIRVEDAGTYELQILDNRSKLYLMQRNSTLSPKEVIDINVPNNVASGVYYIRLINTATKKQWVDKLIVE